MIRIFNLFDKSKSVSFGIKRRPFLFERKGIRGQDAVEFVILLSIILVVLIVILSFNANTMTGYQAKQDTDEASIVLNSMESLGELVYTQGPGSQSMSIINFPDTLKSISVSNSTISVENLNGNVFHRNLEFNATAGNLSSPNGRKALYARSFVGYVVFSFKPVEYFVNHTI
jgi:hypothetical protein